LTERKRFFLAIAKQGERSTFFIGMKGAERNKLKIRSIVTGRLQAVGLEACGHEARCDLVAAGARAAAFQ
jgi:hypothetical protein